MERSITKGFIVFAISFVVLIMPVSAMYHPSNVAATSAGPSFDLNAPVHLASFSSYEQSWKTYISGALHSYGSTNSNDTIMSVVVGLEPSDIPERIVDQLLNNWILKLDYKEMFRHEIIQDFRFKPIRKSGVRNKCSECSEYVYEPDIKILNDKLVCKPDYYGIPKNSV